MPSTLLIDGLNSPLLITEGLGSGAPSVGSVLLIEGLNSLRLVTWGLGSGGIIPPTDLAIYPDPFGSTVAPADPFASTITYGAADPFTSTARLKGN